MTHMGQFQVHTGMCVPMTWGWMGLVVHSGVGTLLEISATVSFSSILSLSSSHSWGKWINKQKQTISEYSQKFYFLQVSWPTEQIKEPDELYKHSPSQTRKLYSWKNLGQKERSFSHQRPLSHYVSKFALVTQTSDHRCFHMDLLKLNCPETIRSL